jgi:hypothetical protein
LPARNRKGGVRTDYAPSRLLHGGGQNVANSRDVIRHFLARIYRGACNFREFFEGFSEKFTENRRVNVSARKLVWRGVAAKTYF